MTALTNVSADTTWEVVSGLQAAADYQFRVSAVNSVGEGTPSSPSSLITLPHESPSGPPLGLVGSARSSTSIMIQWQPPEAQHQNGILHGYMIRYKLYGYADSPYSYRNITNDVSQKGFEIEFSYKHL